MKRSLIAALVGGLAAHAYAGTLPQYQLNDIVVTATRSPVPAAEVASDVTVLTRQDIVQSGATSLPGLLQQQPELEVVSQGGLGSVSSLFIRGANANHTLVLVNGMRIGSATEGTTALENIPLDQIERIEILRGPASSLYGADAIGGVVQIFTRSAQGRSGPRFSFGVGSYGTAQANAGYSLSGKRLRLSIEAGGQSSNGFDATKPGTYGHNPDRDGYRNRNAGFNLEYERQPGHTLGLNAFYSGGRTQYDSSPNADDVQKQRLSEYSFFSRDRILPGWKSTVRIGAGRDHLENLSLTTLFETVQRQYQWQNDLALPAGNLMLALERDEQRVTSTTAYTDTGRNIDSVLAGYRIDRGRHDLQVNLRSDHDNQFGTHVTGSADYGYRLNPAWRLTAGIGNAFKAPTFNDLYWPLQYGYQGNPDLKPEKSVSGELGLHYAAGGARLSVIAFDNRITNLIAIAPDYSTMLNVDQARIRGLSIAAAVRLANWRLNGHLDLQSPVDRTTGNLLPRRARSYGGIEAERRYGAFGVRAGLEASGKRYDDLANTVQLGGYALLNLGADWRLNRDTRLVARLNNVLNKHYELAAGYNTAGFNMFVGLNYRPH